MITAKIDVTKIDKTRLFKGKPGKDGKCPMYLDLALIETAPTDFGDWRDDQTHMIVQSVSKEERAKGITGPILGNACDRSARRTNDQAPADPQAAAAETATTPEDDDVPF